MILNKKRAFKRLGRAGKKGTSMMEVLVTVTLFTIFMTSMLYSFNMLVNINVKVKERIFKTIGEVDEISKKYYLGKEDY